MTGEDPSDAGGVNEIAALPGPGFAAAISGAPGLAGAALARENIAVTLCVTLVPTVQAAAVPVHGPAQPANRLPVFGVAVRIAEEPLAKMAVQLLPQLIPAGWLVTTPRPVPVRLAVTDGMKVAITLLPDSMVNVHVVNVPVHAPFQPVKAGAPGEALRVTVVPGL